MNKTHQLIRAMPSACVVLACGLGCNLAQAAISCEINSVALNFPPYVPFIASPTDENGTIELSCTNPSNTVIIGAPIAIGLGPSAHGTASDRKMAGPTGSLLHYGIFRDAARSRNWEGGGNAYVSRTGALGAFEVKNFTYTLFGRIAPYQNVYPGSYGDSLVVTVSP